MRRIAAAFAAGSLLGGVLVSAIVVFLLHDVDPDLKNALITAFRQLVVETILATVVESAIFFLGLLVMRLVLGERLFSIPASVAFWIAAGARFLEYGWSAYVRFGLKLERDDFSLMLLIAVLILPLLSVTLFAVIAFRRHAQGDPHQRW